MTMHQIRQPCFVAVLIIVASGSSLWAEMDTLVLRNEHVSRELRLVDGAWRTVRFARADGSDAIAVRSEEFHILPLDSRDGWSVADYVAVAAPDRKEQDGTSIVEITYRQRKVLPVSAPNEVIVTYSLGIGPYHHKTVLLVMKEENFVEKTARPIFENLAKHGAHLDAMVPDHGWQNGKTYEYIYQPQDNDTHEPLPEIQRALEQLGTKLGIWIAIDGTNSNVSRGKQIGYRSAYRDDFDRSRRWMQGKNYFDILDPKYQADLRESLRHVLADARVDYIKHDFNHNFTSHYVTERHARGRCLDVTLDLLAYERSLHPSVFQNYTNGSWFSPWWLQHVDTLWMMSGDSGNNTRWPQVSLRDNATTYRDSWIFQTFNNPDRCLRPILPVANLMTHGILYSRKKPYTDFKDPLHEWSDYVVMHLARGTIVKELYVTTDLLDDDHWMVLGKAAAWAQKNQDRLINTVYVGGDPGLGEAYGYVSWVDGRAILAVRNPDRREQVLAVPFDRSVYFRGEDGEAYHARTIYPFVERMPWKLVAGQPMAVPIPGDSVMVFEIEPGPPAVESTAQPKPLPEFQAEIEGGAFSLNLNIPDEELPRFDLLVQPWAAVETAVRIDEKPVSPDQRQQATRWTLARYDLREYRGRNVVIEGAKKMADGESTASGKKFPMEVWLVVDRPVDTVSSACGNELPFAIFQKHRRITQNVIPKTPL